MVFVLVFFCSGPPAAVESLVSVTGHARVWTWTMGITLHIGDHPNDDDPDGRDDGRDADLRR